MNACPYCGAPGDHACRSTCDGGYQPEPEDEEAAVERDEGAVERDACAHCQGVGDIDNGDHSCMLCGGSGWAPLLRTPPADRDAVLAEREACAAIAELHSSYVSDHPYYTPQDEAANAARKAVARAIRARSTPPAAEDAPSRPQESGYGWLDHRTPKG